ncbi:hypothetical protein [Streptomyces sp. NPDC050988]|uniref:hypothetical protein n=1 Tax=Streptomyces sp. NPDC050988 TaxID=3365637 RepID=UPI00378E4118
MANRTDQPPERPSPFAGLPAGHAVNYDNHGSVWGTDTPEATEALLVAERATGTAIEEWNIAALDGQPLRIVRLADPTFLDTICVITGASHDAMSA